MAARVAALALALALVLQVAAALPSTYCGCGCTSAVDYPFGAYPGAALDIIDAGSYGLPGLVEYGIGGSDFVSGTFVPEFAYPAGVVAPAYSTGVVAPAYPAGVIATGYSGVGPEIVSSYPPVPVGGPEVVNRYPGPSSSYTTPPACQTATYQVPVKSATSAESGPVVEESAIMDGCCDSSCAATRAKCSGTTKNVSFKTPTIVNKGSSTSSTVAVIGAPVTSRSTKAGTPQVSTSVIPGPVLAGPAVVDVVSGPGYGPGYGAPFYGGVIEAPIYGGGVVGVIEGGAYGPAYEYGSYGCGAPVVELGGAYGGPVLEYGGLYGGSVAEFVGPYGVYGPDVIAPGFGCGGYEYAIPAPAVLPAPVAPLCPCGPYY